MLHNITMQMSCDNQIEEFRKMFYIYRTTMKSYIIIFTFLFFYLEGFSQSYSVHYPAKKSYRNPDKLKTIQKEKVPKIIPFQFDKSDLTASVFGYLPSDQYPNEKNYLRYDLLTHIVCIDFAADSLGNISNPTYWPWTDVINKAHQNGVKVILCATNFVASQMHYLLDSDSAKQNLFSNLKDKVIMYSLDGVNIDFERFYPTDSGDKLNGLMAELTAYLHTEIPGCEVSFAGPHFNWGGNWKFGDLANACDYIFIMGYAYAGISSQFTGSNAPLSGGMSNVTNTITQQYGDVLQSNPEKLILGVPYYGNKWITRTQDPHAAVVSFVKTQPYSVSIIESQNYGLLWENIEGSPWYRWQVNDTTWYQVWFDNDSSLGLKYDLAKNYNLKGVGMWALGYDGSRAELWNAIKEHFMATSVNNSITIAPAFELSQNYPNPFNPTTTIKFSLSQPCLTTLKIYDIVGKEIVTLVNEEKSTGAYIVEYDASRLSSGIYFYQLQAGDFTETKKMILMR